MKRFLVGLGTIGALAGSVYLGSRLGPTTAPAPTATVTQAVSATDTVSSGNRQLATGNLATAAPSPSDTSLPAAPPASVAPVAPAPPMAPAPATAQPALQSAPEGELQSAPSAPAVRPMPAGNPSSSALASEDEPARKSSEISEEGPKREPATADSKGQPSGDEASPAALPYNTTKYLDPFNEAPPARARFAPSVKSAGDTTPNDWTVCIPWGSPEPSADIEANLTRANTWAAAASAKAELLGFGAGRYDKLHCRGDVIADWFVAGGPEPLGWLGRLGFDSPLATCGYQITVNRPSVAAQYPLVVTFNGTDYTATLASCDPNNPETCTFTFSARCELQRQPIVAKWVGPATTQCLHGDTKTASDGPCEVQP